MNKAMAALSFIAALAIATATVPAFAQSPDQKPVAAKKQQQTKKRVATRHRGSRHIACTFLGCHPVPANCYPVTAYNWDGAPTGFDAVVCR